MPWFVSKQLFPWTKKHMQIDLDTKHYYSHLIIPHLSNIGGIFSPCNWKCKFPMNPHVGLLVGLLVRRRSVCQNFLKGLEASIGALVYLKVGEDCLGTWFTYRGGPNPIQRVCGTVLLTELIKSSEFRKSPKNICLLTPPYNDTRQQK